MWVVLVSDRAGAYSPSPVMPKLKISLKDVPPRKRGEEAATEKQLEFLHELTGIQKSRLVGIGKWQISALIDQALALQNQAGNGVPKVKRKSGCLALLIIGIVVIGGWKIATSKSSDGTRQAPDSSAKRALPTKATTEAELKKDPEKKPPTPAVKIQVPPFLEGAALPVTVVATETLKIRNKAFDEVTIPIGSVIIIETRSDGGNLTMKINGALYVGGESRLVGKVKRQ